MTQPQKPETPSHPHPDWIKKAAVSVVGLYGAYRALEHLHASEARIMAGLQETEAKIADIIHQHYQEQK